MILKMQINLDPERIILSSKDLRQPLNRRTLMQRFPKGMFWSVSLSLQDLPRLAQEEIHLTAPLVGQIDFDGKQHFSLRLKACLEVPCRRCLALLPAEFILDKSLILFDSTAQAERASKSDPGLEVLSSEEGVSLLQWIEDDFLMYSADAHRHQSCPPPLGSPL